MASRGDKIDFTVGDQLDIQDIKGLVELLVEQSDPTIPVRVKSLEDTRTKATRWTIGGIVAIAVAFVIASVKAVVGFF